MSEQWKNDSLKVCSLENRFFPPTKDIWDCFRVCLGPLLPSRETGIHRDRQTDIMSAVTRKAEVAEGRGHGCSISAIKL